MSEFVSHGYNEFNKPPGLPNNPPRPRFELDSPFWDTQLDTSPSQILRAVREGFNELQQANPKVIFGATAFGSLIKGRAHAKSDIDLTIFTNIANQEEANAFLDDHDYPPRVVASYGVSDLISQLLKKACRPHLEKIAAPNSFFDFPTVEFHHLRYARTQDMTDYWAKDLRESFDLNRNVSVPSLLASAFQMRLGKGGIQDLRQSVVDSLERNDVVGSTAFSQTVWDLLKNTVVEKEELRRGAKIYFPDTISDARSYFKLKELPNQD